MNINYEIQRVVSAIRTTVKQEQANHDAPRERSYQDMLDFLERLCDTIEQEFGIQDLEGCIKHPFLRHGKSKTEVLDELSNHADYMNYGYDDLEVKS